MTTTASPLRQVERGELKPKVLTLYEKLFDGTEKDSSYWNELFILRCNTQALTAALNSTTAEQLIVKKDVSRKFFASAIDILLNTNDLAIVDNALVVLMIFLQCVYAKQFVNYSSDIIDVLAGLDKVDTRFNKLMEALNKIIKNAPLNTQVSAIRTATIAAGGAYQTSLASYFTNKDMFKAIMGFIHTPGTELFVGDAFSLIGLLASFDKLEIHNPYRVRLADFIDNTTMLRIVDACSKSWKICLDKYSLTPGPSSSSLASWVFGGGGGGSSNGASNERDGDLEPHGVVSLILAAFEFLNVNKLFARLFVEGGLSQEQEKDQEQKTQMAQFITLSSWLFQSQHKSERSRVYSRIALMMLRTIIEENGSVTSMLVADKYKASIPISQLRTNALPVVKTPRCLLEGIFDALQCALRFNTKRSMDYEMYKFALTTTFQLIAYLRSSNTRLNYHWAELWKTLVSLISFMNSHPDQSADAKEAAELVALIFATCLIHGDAILPDSPQYDDLFYKLIGATNELEKFKTVYFSTSNNPSIGVLIAACNHYKSLLNANQTSKGFSAQQVSQVIKQGYQTLSLHQYASTSNTSSANAKYTTYLLYEPMPRFKEADERRFFKQATRTVISDVQGLYSYM